MISKLILFAAVLACSAKAQDEATEVVQSFHGPIVGAPQKIPTPAYLKDQDFIRIDKKLRRQYRLDGYEVVSVSKQLVFGFNYGIVYKNKNGGKVTFTVYSMFNKIQIVSQSQVKPGEKTTLDQNSLPKLSKNQYENDQIFQVIDSKLQRQSGFNFNGYQIRQVFKQTGQDKNTYNIIYQNSNKAQFHFKVDFVYSETQVTKKVVQGGANIQLTNIEKIQNSVSFKNSQKFLLEKYPQFVSQAQIKDITAQQNARDSETTFNIVLSTSGGEFLAVVVENNKTHDVSIHSLVAIGPKNIRQASPSH